MPECNNCYQSTGSDKGSQRTLGKRGELCKLASTSNTGLGESSNFSTCAITPAPTMLLNLILRWEEILISSHQLLFLTILRCIDEYITMYLTGKA